MRALARARTALIQAFPAALLGALAWQRRWVSDDAFIDFRVVRNLLAGWGPVFNVDERVEAYTNPLWVALLALWAKLGGPLEAGAVAMGLLLTLAGVLAAQAGAERLARGPSNGEPAPLLPLGTLVLAAVPAMWDFATSGLETGLAFAWLGFTYLATCRGATAPAGRGDSLGTAFLAGLGPLIRPDLAVFSACFLAAAVLRDAGSGRGLARAALRLVAFAALVPLSYQLFRMGAFAAVVSNSSIAKEAGLARWRQGWSYLRDFVDPYVLWLPLLALGVLWWRSPRGARGSAVTAALAAPAAGALLHALFVVRVGGDFMHGRLLLPALFGAVMPVAVIALPASSLSRGARAGAVSMSGVVVLWAALCALALRVPYRVFGPAGIADERHFYLAASGRSNPVTAADYAAASYARHGRMLEDALRIPVERGPDGRPRELPGLVLIDLVDTYTSEPLPIQSARLYPKASTRTSPVRLVAGRWNVGLTGYYTGPEVHVVDRHGIADPIASRLRLRVRGRPGHEKDLPNAWIVGRFAREMPDEGADSRAARHALACPALAELLDAVEEPLTVPRFLRNVRLAWRLTRLRIPADPLEAERELCGAVPPPAR